MIERPTESERGAILIEFAFVAPVFLILVFGVVQFGLLLNQQQGLHAAAREGGRLASLAGSDLASVEQQVTDSMVGVQLTSAYTTTISPNVQYPCDGRSGQTVTVTVASQSVLDLPFFSGQVVDMEGIGTFRCE